MQEEIERPDFVQENEDDGQQTEITEAKTLQQANQKGTLSAHTGYVWVRGIL